MPTLDRFTYLEASPRAQRGRPNRTETLVLIHGFPLSAEMWEPQLVLAEQGWRIVAPQLRGFGGTHSEPAVHSVDDYAADIIDLLDGLRVEEAVIGGLSMGGYVTLALFRLAPRYFRGMVLADTRSQADTPEGLEGRRRMLALLQEGGPAAVADDMLPKLLGDGTRRQNPAVTERVRSIILANSADAIAGGVRALMSRPDSTPLLSSIHCPTLIVVGDEDTLTPPSLSDSLHRAIGGSELARIPGAGHMSNLEQPNAFNDALSHFLGLRV